MRFNMKNAMEDLGDVSMDSFAHSLQLEGLLLQQRVSAIGERNVGHFKHLRILS